MCSVLLSVALLCPDCRGSRHWAGCSLQAGLAQQGLWSRREVRGRNFLDLAAELGELVSPVMGCQPCSWVVFAFFFGASIIYLRTFRFQ